MLRLKRWLAVAAPLGLVLSSLFAAAVAHGRDYAGQAFNVLPPGQAGTIPATRNSTDQIALYDGLTPKLGRVRQSDLARHFKSARFGVAGRRQVERIGIKGLRIMRDRWGVPHVTARSRAALMFGSGWVTAEDRGTLMEVLRGPAGIAALDVPGLNPLQLALSLRRFDPSDEAKRFVSRQLSLLRTHGRKGEQVIADFRAYVAGINAHNREAGRPVARWTVNDVISIAALVGAVFGKGGGDEVKRAEFLSALRQRLGVVEGGRVWNDLRQANDREASASLAARFPYGQVPARRPGNAIVDSGSSAFAAAASPVSPQASNALLVSARRSANGHPLFVAGPQVGYFYPEILLEIDLHGGGIDARGAAVPGAAPYVLVGRGQDFAWSATSAGSDVIDQYVETLCGNDTTYRYKGRCVPMRNFNAGVLRAGGGQPRRTITFRQTVHGPVIGYATVGGRRVAISQRRSTRGRDLLNGLALSDLNENRVRSARDFTRVMSQVEFTFNWFYADDRDIAMYSSGRLPVRPRTVDPGLPTIGAGAYEWRGFLRARQHPQRVNPTSGAIVNWNNKPARGFGASDSNWSYGSIHRNQLLEQAIEKRREHTLTSVVGAMNEAATQDLRAAMVLRSIAGVLETGPAPNARAARMLKLLRDWRARGANRIDRGLDGKIDHPGAAILDAAWPRIADAVMGPVLGPQLDALARLVPRDQSARSLGSSYGDGWYGYVDKDLRRLRGRKVQTPFRTRFCGGGNLGVCRAALWAALDAAGSELAARQGPNPNGWRADATGERIVFEPGLLGAQRKIRWTNRPTFQQVMYFRGHR